MPEQTRNSDSVGEENAALRGLIRHIDIHSAYPHNGYGKMTTEQKALYRRINGLDDEWHEAVMAALSRPMTEAEFRGLMRRVSEK